jgi:hypothetical protein
MLGVLRVTELVSSKQAPAVSQSLSLAAAAAGADPHA